MVPYRMGPVGPFGDSNERSMKAMLGEVLSQGSGLQHIYDFGTSTELKVRVAANARDVLAASPYAY
jgi:hypothetical protein